jgi:hypothetical protein
MDTRTQGRSLDLCANIRLGWNEVTVQTHRLTAEVITIVKYFIVQALDHVGEKLTQGPMQ